MVGQMNDGIRLEELGTGVWKGWRRVAGYTIDEPWFFDDLDEALLFARQEVDGLSRKIEIIRLKRDL